MPSNLNYSDIAEYDFERIEDIADNVERTILLQKIKTLHFKERFFQSYRSLYYNEYQYNTNIVL